jgi:zinc/manganese transport system substrate-binding protein
MSTEPLSLADALSFGFLRRAAVAALVLGLSMAPLGLFVLQRRMSLVGDAMAHAVLPGAAVGYLVAGLSVWALAIGGATSALLVALGAGFLSRRGLAREDGSFAALYLIAVAIGVLLVSASGSPVDLAHLLFGSVLAVDTPGLWLVFGVAAVTWAGLALLYRPLVLDALGPELGSTGAAGEGRTQGLHAAFVVLLVLNLVAGFQVLGTLLSVGLLILPAATARLWAQRLETQFGLAMGLSAAAAAGGLLLSFRQDLPSGPAIVLVAGAGYLGSLLRLVVGQRRPAPVATTLRAGLLASALAFTPAPSRAGDAPLPPLRVVASFSVLGDLVREVGGDRVDVRTLVGPDADAHVYEPRPSDLAAVAKAELLVVNGLGFEGWMSRLATSSGFRGRLVTASDGVRVIGSERHPDPHAWHDPRNVIVYVANLRAALVALRPADAAFFDARAARYTAELRRLYAASESLFAAVPAGQRSVITSHDAFTYFGAAYRLALQAPQGTSTDAQASAATAAALAAQVRRHQVRALFIENVSDPRLLQQIAAEGGARIGGRLYSDALSPPGGPAATYLDMHRHNVRSVVDALR